MGWPSRRKVSSVENVSPPTTITSAQLLSEVFGVTPERLREITGEDFDGTYTIVQREPEQPDLPPIAIEAPIQSRERRGLLEIGRAAIRLARTTLRGENN